VGGNQEAALKEGDKLEEVANISASQLSRLRQTPARALGKGTPVVDKAAQARAAKQLRKDNIRKALATIKHKVPKEGRGIF
jgi:vacuolar-type H+-ATPase subunit I/STV1